MPLKRPPNLGLDVGGGGGGAGVTEPSLQRSGSSSRQTDSFPQEPPAPPRGGGQSSFQSGSYQPNTQSSQQRSFQQSGYGAGTGFAVPNSSFSSQGGRSDGYSQSRQQQQQQGRGQYDSFQSDGRGYSKQAQPATSGNYDYPGQSQPMSQNRGGQFDNYPPTSSQNRGQFDSYQPSSQNRGQFDNYQPSSQNRGGQYEQDGWRGSSTSDQWQRRGNQESFGYNAGRQQMDQQDMDTSQTQISHHSHHRHQHHQHENKASQHLALQPYQPKEQGRAIMHMVPLPRFTGLGVYEAPDPTPEQEAEVGRLRRQMEYHSQACHLGQYDYDPTKPPIYYPRQDMIDKKEWADDPFFGWRTDPQAIQEAAATRRRRQGLHSRPFGEIHDQDEADRWNKDPFHGWLRTSEHMHEAGQERIQAATVERKLMSLPSFSADEKGRTDDGLHHEYAAGHRWNTRIRREPNTVVSHDKLWKDDAFFGWLPGRGTEREQTPMLQRPLQQARLEKLPSFSENALLGLSGRGVGVIKVWVHSATNLTYGDQTGLQGRPSSCVRIRMLNQETREMSQPKYTKSIHQEPNPRWNAGAFVFEVQSINDVLICDVIDMEVHGKQPVLLGKFELPVRRVVPRIYDGERTDRGGGPVSCGGRLDQARPGAELDLLVEYDHYDDGRRRMQAPQPDHNPQGRAYLQEPVRSAHQYSGWSDHSPTHSEDDRATLAVDLEDEGYMRNVDDVYGLHGPGQGGYRGWS